MKFKKYKTVLEKLAGWIGFLRRPDLARGPNFGDHYARELFKPSKDSLSLH